MPSGFVNTIKLLIKHKVHISAGYVCDIGVNSPISHTVMHQLARTSCQNKIISQGPTKCFSSFFFGLYQKPTASDAPRGRCATVDCPHKSPPPPPPPPVSFNSQQRACSRDEKPQFSLLQELLLVMLIVCDICTEDLL